MVRPPVGLAVVKVLTVLPDSDRRAVLPGVLHTVANVLKGRHQGVRYVSPNSLVLHLDMSPAPCVSVCTSGCPAVCACVCVYLCLVYAGVCVFECVSLHRDEARKVCVAIVAECGHTLRGFSGQNAPGRFPAEEESLLIHVCVLRDEARKVFVAMVAELGSPYLRFGVEVLQAALPAKGYTAQVLGYTVHALLDALSHVRSTITSNIIPNLIKNCMMCDCATYPGANCLTDS